MMLSGTSETFLVQLRVKTLRDRSVRKKHINDNTINITKRNFT